MEEFIRSTTVQIALFLTGISGWVLAIYTTFIQKKSYDMQLDSEKAYEEIMSRAKNDWEGKYTKEQVDALKTELSALKNEIEKNKKDIPIKAKEVFLKDQLFTLNSSLEELYSQREKVVTEIDKIEKKGGNLNIDNKIEKEVEDLLKPIYIKKRNQERTNKVALYSILLIASVLVLPFLIHILSLKINHDGFFFGRGEGVPIYAILVTLLFFATGIYLSYRKRITNSNLIKKYSIGFYALLLIQLVISLGGIGFVIFILFEAIDYNYINSSVEPVIIGLIFTLIISICFGYMIQLWKILNKE